MRDGYFFFSFDASSSLVVRVMRDGFPPSHPFAILLRGGGGGLYHNLYHAYYETITLESKIKRLIIFLKIFPNRCDQTCFSLIMWWRIWAENWLTWKGSKLYYISR